MQEFTKLEGKKQKLINDPYMGLIPGKSHIEAMCKIRERQVAIMIVLGFDNFTEVQRREAARFLQEKRMKAERE